MNKFIRKSSFPSQQKSFYQSFSFSNFHTQNRLFGGLFSNISRQYYFSAVILKESENLDSKYSDIPTFTWPWMYLDNLEGDIQLDKREKVTVEKYPDVSDEGFISKKEFNPANGLEMYEKFTPSEESFFPPEGISYEEFQTLL